MATLKDASQKTLREREEGRREFVLVRVPFVEIRVGWIEGERGRPARLKDGYAERLLR